MNWSTLQTLAKQPQPFVLVTVGQVKGSTPRETGAKMVVMGNEVIGTIGGGNLEFFAIQHAQQVLINGQENQLTQHITPLIPKYDQCCGGVVTLIFEKVNTKNSSWLSQIATLNLTNNAQNSPKINQHPEGHKAWLISDLKTAKRQVVFNTEMQDLKPIWLTSEQQLVEAIQPAALSVIIFGAGHVSKALMQQLQWLDTQITCVDGRAEQLPNAQQFSRGNVQLKHTDAWQTVIQQAPVNSYFLVMTHSHQLDYQITHSLLTANQFNYIGLIGSRTKKIRFERQFKKQGLNETQIAQLTCPIGLPEIVGKTPEIIAASVIAQILAETSQMSATHKQPILKCHLNGDS